MLLLATKASADDYNETKIADPQEHETIPPAENEPGMKVSWYPAIISGQDNDSIQYELDMIIVSGTVGLSANSLL